MFVALTKLLYLLHTIFMVNLKKLHWLLVFHFIFVLVFDLYKKKVKHKVLETTPNVLYVHTPSSQVHVRVRMWTSTLNRIRHHLASPAHEAAKQMNECCRSVMCKKLVNAHAYRFAAAVVPSLSCTHTHTLIGPISPKPPLGLSCSRWSEIESADWMELLRFIIQPTTEQYNANQLLSGRHSLLISIFFLSVQLELLRQPNTHQANRKKWSKKFNFLIFIFVSNVWRE